jgi:transcriptional regulator with XRE-family HTH domain
MVRAKQKTTSKSPYAILAGNRIKECRAKVGLTQEGLSEATGARLSPTRIANYEQGSRELYIEPAIILGEALGEPAGYLMGVLGEEDRKLISAPPTTKIKLLSMIK